MEDKMEKYGTLKAELYFLCVYAYYNFDHF